MDTLFDPVAYADIQRRLASISPDSPRQWGTMSVAQMLEHTARALEVAVGSKASKQAMLGTLIGWIFRRAFVGPKPFGRNAPTGPDFVVQGEPDFEQAKGRVSALLRELHGVAAQGCDGRVHGFFGRMTGAEWGVTQHKHVDHHLRQFGA